MLAAHLDPTPSVKWSKGASPLAAQLPAGASVRSVLLPYSDASLFGLLVQTGSVADVKVITQAAVAALKGAGEALQRPVTKARFVATAAYDAQGGLVAEG